MRKSEFTHEIVSERFTRLFASMVIAIGLLVLIGWYSGLMFLTRFSINEVPMAPSTAYVFVFMAVGLWFYLRPQKIAINRNVTIASTGIAICLSCLLFITNTLKYYANWEHAFINLPETQLSMQLGHMSLVTAILFIISGFALLFLLSNRKTVKTVGIILTLTIFIISFILLLGYGFAAPFFYFDNFIPPAVLTVLSFLLISLALIAATDKNTFLVKTIWKTSTSAKLLRVFLPTTIAITVIESLIVIRILPLINIHPAFGVSLGSLIVVAVVIIVISIISKSMGKSLDSALENLSESEKFSKGIIEAMSDGFSILDENGVHIDVNLAFCKMTGFAKEELIGVGPPHPYWPEEEYEKIQEAFVKTAQGNFGSFELVFKKKNGKRFPVLVNPSQIKDDDGNVVSNFATVVNITERKQAENILQETNARHSAMIENIGDVIAIIDSDGVAKYQSPNIEKWFGWKPEDLIGANGFEKMHPEDIEFIQKEFSKVLQKETASLVEYRFKCKDGSYKWIELTAVNRINDTTINGVLLNYHDITERKLSEQALKESKDKLNLIINASPIGICTADSLGNFLMTNPAYEQIVGYSKEECKSLSFFDVTHPNDRPNNKKLFQSMFSLETKGFSIKKRYIRKDGSEIDVDVHAIGIMDAEGNIKFGTAFVDDITERKRAEEEIKKNQILLQQAEEISNQGAWEWDVVKDEWTFSENWLRVHGCRLSGISREELMTISYPEDAPKVERAFQDALKGGSPYNIEHRIVRQNDGEVRYVRAKGNLIINDFGQPVKMYGVAQDITDSRLVEEALRESEEKFRKLFHSTTLPLCFVANNGTITIRNERFNETFGYTYDEVPTLKEWWLKAYPNEEYRKWAIKNWETAVAEAAKTGKDIKSDEYKVTCKDGTIRDIVISGSIIEENFLATFIDLTERKLAEKALRESEAKLNALFTSLTEMVVMHELVLSDAGKAIDYRIIDCNKVFTKVTGIPKEDAIGKLASEVYQSNPPPYLEKYAKVALDGDPQEFTSYNAPLDKHFMISVVSPQTGKFATITTDISAMMQIQEMIVAKNKEMENYLYVASHDLRTPLVNIQGFSLRLKKQADSIKTLFADKTLEPEILHQLGIITDEDIPKTLSFVLSNIEKMDTLIKGLLQLSRTGRIEMNIQKINMNALFVAILQSLDFQIKEAQCKIHVNPLPECYGDAALLDQLFANIISNALKYSDSERALEITVDAKHIHNRLVYTIRDTGKGIAKKHLDKIWDIFYRIDPRSGKTGEGIGLSLVKRIAEKHKGKVWAESEENKGSNFYIELHNRTFTEF